jgi:hypothetical protein
MPIWVRPSSPTVNGCRPSATLIEHPAYVRSPPKCATCAICARSPRGQASLTPRRSGHASLPEVTPACSVARAPTPSRAFARFRHAPACRASQQPSATISSRPSPYLRHWHFPSKISFSPYTFPRRRIRRRADSTSHPGRLSSQSPALQRSFAHGPFQPLVSSSPLSFEAFGMKTILPNFVPVYEPVAVGHKAVKN